MRLLRKGKLLLRSLTQRRQLDNDLAEELQFHEEQLRAELQAQGLEGRAQDLAVRKKLGSLATATDQSRDARGLYAWETFWQDAKFACRHWLRFPGLAAALLLTLALTVGASSIISALLFASLLRPLPFPDAEQLFTVVDGGFNMLEPSRRLAERTKIMAIASYRPGLQVVWQGPNGAVEFGGAAVSPKLFTLMGERPITGRMMRDQDIEPGRERVVWISYDFARTWFPEQPMPQLVGKPIRLNETDYTIAGIMRPEFSFPNSLHAGRGASAFWVPQIYDPRNSGNNWGSGGVHTIVRVPSPGLRERAQEELSFLTAQIQKEFPWQMPAEWGRATHLEPLRDSYTGSIRQPILVLFVAVQLLYVLGWLNAASILFSRGLGRLTELETRSALGAGRARVIRQLLVEYFLLGSVGTLLGVLLAWALFPVSQQLFPISFDQVGSLQIDASVLWFQAGCMLLAVLVFGLGLSWRLTADETAQSKPLQIKQGRLLSALVIGQVAFASALVLLSLLAARSLWNLMQQDTGVAQGAMQNVISGQLQLPRSLCKTSAACFASQAELLQTLAAAPGVTASSSTEALPLQNGMNVPRFAAAIEDHPKPASEPAFMLTRIGITPDYFSVMGVGVLQGRGILATDTADGQKVAVISQSMAKRFWPNGTAIGKRLRPVWLQDWVTIVGVVGDVAQFSLAGTPGWCDGQIYTPLSQGDVAGAGIRTLSFAVRTSQPQAFTSRTPALLVKAFPAMAVPEMQNLQEIRDASLGLNRGLAQLLAAFSGLSLLLGCLGIYGVVVRRLQSRLREFGIRMALGASPDGVARLLVWQAVRLAGAGLFVGTGAYFLVLRWAMPMLRDADGLQPVLFAVSVWDPVAVGGTIALFVLATAIAAAMPAARASRLDLATTLRAN